MTAAHTPPTPAPGSEAGPREAGPELLLITGMSGAGKGSAARVLEEFGWYVVDNLPVDMLGELFERAIRPGDAIPRLAVVADVRSRNFLESPGELHPRFGDRAGYRVLFLDATDDALVQRFNSVRRAHPLAAGNALTDGIERERGLLAGLREGADMVLDTTALSVHDLRRRLEPTFGDPHFAFHVTVESFGFKYGVPRDVDMLLDMRFLPNPHWVPELRELTGRTTEVQDYVLADPAAEHYLDHALAMIPLAIAGYRREGKRYLTVGVGCTGGKHRSVAVAETLARRLAETFPSEVDVHCLHRDLGRE